jgi:hypothetical protein
VGQVLTDTVEKAENELTKSCPRAPVKSSIPQSSALWRAYEDRRLEI